MSTLVQRLDDERRLEISGLLGSQQYLLHCGAGVRTAGCVLSSLDRISQYMMWIDPRVKEEEEEV